MDFERKPGQPPQGSETQEEREAKKTQEAFSMVRNERPGIPESEFYRLMYDLNEGPIVYEYSHFLYLIKSKNQNRPHGKIEAEKGVYYEVGLPKFVVERLYAKYAEKYPVAARGQDLAKLYDRGGFTLTELKELLSVEEIKRIYEEHKKKETE